MKRYSRGCGAGDEWAANSSPETRAKFLAQVTESGGCWLFRATGNSKKYGICGGEGHRMTAHRFSKIIHHGKPPDSALFACHTCRMKRCVNPLHLVWQTAKQNWADMLRDGTFTPRNNFQKFTKLNGEKARQIFIAYHQNMVSAGDLAKTYEVGRASIHKIASRQCYKKETDGLPMRPVSSDGKTVRRGIHHKNAVLNDKKVIEIREKLLMGSPFAALEAEYGLSTSGVAAIKAGRTWKHLLPQVKTERQAYLEKFRTVRSPRNRLTSADKKEAIAMLARGQTQKQVSHHFGVCQATISLIRIRFAADIL